MKAGRFSWTFALPVWLLVIVCSGLPLAWIVAQLALDPRVLVEAIPDGFRAKLLGRTLLYNAAVAVVATTIAIPAALVLGRGRGGAARVLWLALPASLLLPSIVYAYGWSQFLRLLSLTPEPAGKWDVARCVWSLAAWLWPLPAGVVGLALRRVDANLQQQAVLDGALWRVTARQVLAPLAAGAAMAGVLAMQEFAVYEPTGISVVATEVRMVFETGAFSSSGNPITAPLGGGGGWGGGEVGDEGAGVTATAQGAIAAGQRPARLLDPSVGLLPDQRHRAAAAVATALPLLLVIALLATIATWGVRRFSASEDVDTGPWPRVLDAPWWAPVVAALVVLVTLGVPLVSLVLSLHRRLDPGDVWRTFEPQIVGTMIVAGITGAVALAAAGLAAARWPRASLVTLVATFLVGGQLLAIAQIRLYNRPWLGGVVYNAAPIVVLAFVARFGWVALLAAAGTWSRAWRPVRDLAAIDGAGALTTAAHVTWPLAWPILGAAAVLVAILSLTEVPASVLLSPQRPPLLTPLLMTWVHMLRYDDMIAGSLLMAGMVFVLVVMAVGLTVLGLRRWEGRSQKAEGRGGRKQVALSGLILLSAFCLLLSPGCDQLSSTPDAVWDEKTGVPLVYPRAITYAPGDDSFFVIDRLAIVQHVDRRGTVLGEWRMPEHLTGKPVGVSVGPDGNVYVPDTHYHRVMVYSPKGELLRQWGKQGTGPGEFIYTTDIAFDRRGNVFVSEYGDNDRIQVFTPDGMFLYQFGTFGQDDGQFMRPQSIAIDPEKDLVYVTDACNHRLVVFKTDGTWVRNMGAVGSGPGEFRFPYGLDRDSDGRLVVCEFGNNRIQLVDPDTGRGLATWGGAGRDPGQLAYPWGVAVDKDDRVVAVDAGNNRLQVFEF